MRLRTTLKTALLLTLAAGLLAACRSSRPAGGKPSTIAVSDLETRGAGHRASPSGYVCECQDALFFFFPSSWGTRTFSIGGNFPHEEG